MHEELTQHVTPPHEIIRATARMVMDMLEPRFASLEQLIANRLNDTQPIWPQILAGIQDLNVRVGNLETQNQAIITEQQKLATEQQKLATEQQKLATEQQRLATELASFRQQTDDNFRRVKEGMMEVFSESWMEVRTDYKYLRRRLDQVDEQLVRNAA